MVPEEGDGAVRLGQVGGDEAQATAVTMIGAGPGAGLEQEAAVGAMDEECLEEEGVEMSSRLIT
jgi:hypothetical protein